MRQKILSIVIFLTLFFNSAQKLTSEPQPFLAVFANPGFKRISRWNQYHPDLLYSSTDWYHFEDFLIQVNRKAGHRPIVIDVDCHGDPENGMLAIQYQVCGTTITDEASVGFVIEEIKEMISHKKDLTVLLEACYSGYCMSHTLKSQVLLEGEGYHVRPYEGNIPFPVYGIGNTVNYNNLVYLQYKYKIHQYFYDLREDIGKDIKLDDSSIKDLEIRSLCALLSTYGID